jgi:type IV secretory pathway VirB9-like protein
MRPSTTLQRLMRSTRPLLLLAGLPLLGTVASAQVPLNTGDGRTHGAPTREVSYAAMTPDAVQTLLLNPHYHMMVEFPDDVLRIDVGDQKIAKFAIIDNKVSIKAARTEGETSMTIILDDDRHTVLAFKIRCSAAATPVSILRFTDPVAKHIREDEIAMAERYEKIARAKQGVQLENLIRSRLTMGLDVDLFDPTRAQESQLNKFGERVTLQLVKIVYLAVSPTQFRAYLHYRIANLTAKPLESPTLSLSLAGPARRQGDVESEEVYDVEDSRGGAVVPPGTLVDGLLVFDRPALKDGDLFSVSLEAPSGVQVRVQTSPKPAAN